MLQKGVIIIISVLLLTSFAYGVKHTLEVRSKPCDSFVYDRNKILKEHFSAKTVTIRDIEKQYTEATLQEKSLSFVSEYKHTKKTVVDSDSKDDCNLGLKYRDGVKMIMEGDDDKRDYKKNPYTVILNFPNNRNIIDVAISILKDHAGLDNIPTKYEIVYFSDMIKKIQCNELDLLISNDNIFKGEARNYFCISDPYISIGASVLIHKNPPKRFLRTTKSLLFFGMYLCLIVAILVASTKLIRICIFIGVLILVVFFPVICVAEEVGVVGVQSLEQIRDRVIYTEAGPHAEWLKENGYKTRTVHSIGQAYTLLKERRIEAVLHDTDSVYAFAKQNSDLATLPREYNKSDYCFVTTPKHKIYIDRINVILRQIKEDGRYDELIKKWLNIMP